MVIFMKVLNVESAEKSGINVFTSVTKQINIFPKMSKYSFNVNLH